jgi:nickel transport system ATP-binding protein
MPIIELRNIHKSYQRGGLWANRQRLEVIKGVDLSIEPGQCLGLLGRSGSGKSTLGRIVLGLESPDKGEVWYQGAFLKDLKGDAWREYRRNVQVVFQNSLGSVNPRFTAGQIISEPLRNFEALSTHKLRKRVEELLKMVGLSEMDADKFPHQFSGGELQRVCIARAISLNPRLIILDEAVSSLDMLVQAKIIQLLTRLQGEIGTAYLFISHDIRVLLKVAHQLLVMHDGRIVDKLNADTSDVGKHDLRHPAFMELIRSILPSMPNETLPAPRRMKMMF